MKDISIGDHSSTFGDFPGPGVLTHILGEILRNLLYNSQ